MDNAGIPYVVDRRPSRSASAKAGQTVERRMYKYTNHSLRDRCATSALNKWGYTKDELMVVGGWENSKVIHERYYGASTGTLDRLRQ